ncbi:hypothetical protein OHA37_00060 [Streptomyces sp. NBC_00335]|uniref:hypothetical protein n=1 Tax=unclassified Streptomyces TaxID=2593676 RepID=UPI002250258E|nr:MULTISPECIES: hypothetical protein [unclassified Streptomyces]MCX5410164.1 hypothetical protein [Streptomyces sp. NBC_00086]
MSERILYYGASGRGCIGTIDANNVLDDVEVLPEGAFAPDWTLITALSNNCILHYAGASGRACIGSIDAENVLQDVVTFPEAPVGPFSLGFREVATLRGDLVLFYADLNGHSYLVRIPDDNTPDTISVYNPGEFAPDWRQITWLGGNRFLFCGAGGRGVVCTLGSNNIFHDGPVFPEGPFAPDWKQITAFGDGRILYYGASGRGLIGTVDGDNDFDDWVALPEGTFAPDWIQITSLRVPG